MSTMIIKANGVIANPAYGKVYEGLNSDLRLLIDARELTDDYNVGDRVSTFNASMMGYATDAEKVFDARLGETLAPELSADLGIPTLKFSGFESIYNSATASTEAISATYVLVVKQDADNGFYNRIFGVSDTSSRYHAVRAAYGGKEVSMRAGHDVRDSVPEKVDTNADVGVLSNELQVAVFVFDGENSYAIYGNDVDTVHTANLSLSSLSRIVLGANAYNKDDGQCFFGHIGYFAQYGKALTTEQAKDEINRISQEFAL